MRKMSMTSKVVMQAARPLDRFVMRFTCHYGLHDWTFFRMANSFITAFPNDLAINRRCDRCGHMQCTDDGKTWMTRI